MNEQIVLRYIGEGTFVFGVPARDLTQADIDACDFTAAELLGFSPAVYEPVQPVAPAEGE